MQREIDHAKACDKSSKIFKRLLLFLIEIEMRQNYFDTVECLISELLNIYNKIAELDINDRVNHVRALIVKTRFSQSCKAK